MTDSPPKRRAWFQLHLSTCVVLMVVAGVLLWANTREPKIIKEGPINVEPNNTDGNWFMEAEGPGWPFPTWRIAFTAKTREDGHQSLPGPEFAFENLNVALCVLAFVAWAIEYLMRKTERRRLSHLPDN